MLGGLYQYRCVRDKVCMGVWRGVRLNYTNGKKKEGKFRSNLKFTHGSSVATWHV